MNDICKVCYETIKTGESKCSNCGAEVIREVASLSNLLRACPVCTAKVFSMALSCPCCGHQIHPPQTQTDANVIVTGCKRLFDLGSIHVGSAGTGETEIKIVGINSPGTVRDRITKAKSVISQ